MIDDLYLDMIHSHQTFNHTIFNDMHVITDMQLKWTDLINWYKI